MSRAKRTVGFFTNVLRRHSADTRQVHCQFFQIVDELLGDESAGDPVEQVAQIRNALTAADALIEEIVAGLPVTPFGRGQHLRAVR